MLSRRNLRVKVMQVLYAYEQNNSSSLFVAENNISKSIDKSYDLLIFNLSLLVRIANRVNKEAELRASKHLRKDEDLNFSVKLAENLVIIEIKGEKKVAALLKLQPEMEEADLVRSVFKKLLPKEPYKEYCQADNDIQADQKIILYIYNKLLVKSDLYRQYVEDTFPDCVMDVFKINQATNALIEDFSIKTKKIKIDIGSAANEKKFAKALFHKTITKKNDLTQLIEPKLENWDLDRIAFLDMILMKMALCELLYFPQIPVKVSINEYIDISKIYSTPKSKDFINGILDKILHELKTNDKIKKTGRGLVE